MRIVFSGSIGRFPVGGHAWVDLQYLLGLRAMGHDVFYLEDSGPGSWVYDWQAEQLTTDLSYPTAYVRECLEPLGFADRWIYRSGDVAAGMALEAFAAVCDSADLLIVRGAPLERWRPEYDRPARRIYIDSDPGFNQMRLASGHPYLTSTVQRCERVFTIGQRIGTRDCAVPTVGRTWIRTVPPVALAHWPWADEYATDFTTVMQWHSYDTVVHAGVGYGNKSWEFARFLHLPSLTPQPFRVAMSGGDLDYLHGHGWKVETGWSVSRTPRSYGQFIRESKAEFAVAKHGYVATGGGWVSDRTTCYLASGRPALVQDSGLAGCLPTGEGLLTFRDAGEALAGVAAINDDYEHHRRAARRLAEEHFAADDVLAGLLEAAMA
ncbi:MAG: glycosyltransferase [Actinomycetota bacterium]|nr:glycosyltransferase [Actinomycetota bacterium]